MEWAMPDDELDPEQVEGLDENIRRALRGQKELAREKAAAEERAAELERQLAFTKAGVPDTPLATALAKTYDGDNDPAAVKAYFEGLGVDLSGKSDTAQQDPQAEAELEAQRRLAQVGSEGGQGGDIRFEDALISAKDVNEVMALLASAPEGATDYEGRRIGVPRID